MTHKFLKTKARARLRFFTAALAVITGVAALSACSPSAASSDTDGVLRVGVLGSGTSETLNPTQMDTEASVARGNQIFEPLVRLGPGDEMVDYVLAESFTRNDDGSVWTLKLRSGVTWHDGTPLTVDDVIYTMNYNVENVTWGSTVWQNVDRANLKKIDDLTLDIPLVSPNFLYPEGLVDVNEMIIKNGTTSFEQPVGTGPFMFESFSPGQQSTFVRNDNYWGGAPKLAAVEIHSINDATARVNALMSGQVDAVANVPFSAIPQLEDAGLTVTNEPSGTWVALRMNTQVEPFDDPRVREAMALLIDREQIVDNAYGGNGQIANDLFGWFDPNYANLPQRTYDPERARELLAEAGYEDLSITLPTSDLGPGISEMVTLFAASAAEAGVTVNVQELPLAEFYGTPPAELLIAPTYWVATPISAQINNQMSQAAIDAGVSETQWNDPEFLSAYKAALATSDPVLRRERLVEIQTQIHNENPYIIPAFFNIVTANSNTVTGLETNVRGPFGDWNFADVTVE